MTWPPIAAWIAIGKHLARDQLFELEGDLPPPGVRAFPMDDHGERVDRFPVQE